MKHVENNLSPARFVEWTIDKGHGDSSDFSDETLFSRSMKARWAEEIRGMARVLSTEGTSHG